MKNKFDRVFFLIIFFTLINLSFVYGETVEDVTVKANLNLQIESKKEPMIIDIDKDKILDNMLSLDDELLQKSPLILLDPSFSVPDIVFSFNVISPFGIDILPQPFLNFEIKTSQNFKVDEWAVIFSDSKGDLFSAIKGAKTIPQYIAWDGISSITKHILTPGQWYSYILRVRGNDNNIRTINGEPFNIKGYQLNNDDYKNVTISLEEIFDLNTETTDIKKNSENLLREVLDILKEFYDKDIVIVVYDKNTDIAQKRANVLKDYFKTHMYIASSNVNALGKQVYISEYKIDIFISKLNMQKRNSK
jgi:hypothetical protein